jgi:hypothetical protein
MSREGPGRAAECGQDSRGSWPFPRTSPLGLCDRSRDEGVLSRLPQKVRSRGWKEREREKGGGEGEEGVEKGQVEAAS